ncbi:MAG: phosphoenolpyruvate mutase [Gammaproteobacteria bacterium]|jgi:phosphoenolpyruvate phosphomutase|nr:phosphoenolpyruvate mutase [Gammaproteobacteria bacterium]
MKESTASNIEYVPNVQRQDDRPKKTKQFRDLLMNSELEFLLEAHNGITAKIGEEVGFKSLWAGGLCMSAQYGVRDSNEASWTQVLEMLEFMSDAVSIPILLDGDTGYGNFNNVRRLIKKLEQRDIAAVCIEDKLYPKTNSFIDGNKQQLADIDEFCSRIKAGKDAQSDDDFCIITRVEAFIAGWGLDEAMRRAEAYHAAGADGILIHSALRIPDEILAFKKEWGDRLPVVIVPTKYYATPTEVLREAGFSICIWANHMLRCAIPAMQECAKMLKESQTLCSIEDNIAPVGEIFRLQGASELKQAEKHYLSTDQQDARAIVLAASRGTELGDLTEDKPKAMIPVRGKPLLSHIVSSYNAVGLKRISVVTGYRSDAFTLTGLKYVENPDFSDTGELNSLALALDADPDNDSDLYISYGDVLFKQYILDILSEVDGPFAIVVDADWRDSVNRGRPADYVTCTEPHSRHSFYHKVLLENAAEDIPEIQIHGEWMGFLKVSSSAMPVFRAAVSKLMENPENRQAKLFNLLTELRAQQQEIQVMYTTGHWLDVDSVDDLVTAGSFT